MRIPALEGRKQIILDTLAREIGLQQGGTVPDLVALAVAVDRALGGDGLMPGEPFEDGKKPGELNAANDG